MGYKLVVKKTIVLSLFILFVVCILGFTTLLANASLNQLTTVYSISARPTVLANPSWNQLTTVYAISTGAFAKNVGTPTITWSNPDDIVYGTPLGSTQLDATATDTTIPLSGAQLDATATDTTTGNPVDGTFVYDPPEGTILDVGLAQPLVTTFTPTSTDYNSTSKSVVINCINTTLITPILTWSNPANIVYGTPLSSTQLDATATDTTTGNPVDGTFVYNPAAGTILGAGQQQTLSTAFTPNDFANYTTASGSASINVIPTAQGAALTIVKSAYPTSYDDVGQTITYNYKVTNSGKVNLSAPITVTDDKFGIISLQNSGILSPGSNVTGTVTYKITDADINTGSVTNLAAATGSFNGETITSNDVIAVVPYEQQNNDRANNGGPDNGGYGGAVVPVVPAPMMYSSPMYSSEPSGAIETQNSDSNGHKAKAHLRKHKNKHHTTKHHKTRKKHLVLKDKN
jgi:hypothetical protein